MDFAAEVFPGCSIQKSQGLAMFVLRGSGMVRTGAKEINQNVAGQRMNQVNRRKSGVRTRIRKVDVGQTNQRIKLERGQEQSQDQDQTL